MASKLIMNVSGFSSGTEYTKPVRLAKTDARAIAAHFQWSAALTATPLIEVSNDPALHGLLEADGAPSSYSAAGWIPYSAYATFVQPPAGGSERDGGYNTSFFGYEFVRYGLVWGAGTADVTCWYNVIK